MSRVFHWLFSVLTKSTQIPGLNLLSNKNVALAHPRMARQGEVIPPKRIWTLKKAQQMNRISKEGRKLLFLPCSGIEPGTSGNSDIAMTPTPHYWVTKSTSQKILWSWSNTYHTQSWLLPESFDQEVASTAFEIFEDFFILRASICLVGEST